MDLSTHDVACGGSVHLQRLLATAVAGALIGFWSGCGADPETPPSADVAVAPSDVGQDVVSDVGQDVASDVGQDVASDVGQDVASDVGQDVASDVGQDVASDVGQDVASDVKLDMATDTADTDAAQPVSCALPSTGLAGVTFSGSGRYRVAPLVPWSGLLPRDVVVFLPADYEDASAAQSNYPVLYMHDGQNLFEDSEAAFGVAWEVDDVLDALVGSGSLEPHIVVALNNTAERADDYTPVYDANFQEGGKGDLYADFVATGVKPLIDATFRTRCGRVDTVVVGSSLGGLISLHIGQRHPDIFGRIGAVSPSLWWADGVPAAGFMAWEPSELPYRLWIDGGGAEAHDPDLPGLSNMVANARALRDALLALGMSWPATLGYLEEPRAEHNEAAWEHRLPSILGFLLRSPDAPLPAPTDMLLETFGPFIATSAVDPAYETTAASAEVRFGDIRLSVSAPSATWSVTSQAVVAADGWVTAGSEGLAMVQATWSGFSAERSLAVLDGAGGVAVAMRVLVPQNTPEEAVVRLLGGAAALGAWDETAGLDATPLGGGWHEVRWVRSMPWDAVEYKWTLGSWATVEKGEGGVELANRVLGAYWSPLTTSADVVGEWAALP